MGRAVFFYICWALLIGNASGVTWAQATPLEEAWPETIVKITSQPCRGYPVYNGTGLLFHANGQVFVLTSDHVFLHDNDKICHTVSNEAIGEEKAQYFAADWATGLGVLKVPGLQESSKQRPLEELTKTFAAAPAGSVKSTHLLTVGYPAASDTLLSSYRGDVAGSISSEKIFFNQFQLIETKNAHGEFGMSGGPVFAGPHSQYAGVLSHQILRPTSEKEREAAPWDASSEVENNLLIIPQAVVGPWLEKLFARGGSEGYTLYEYSWQQLNQGHNWVTVENLSLSMSCTEAGAYTKKGCSVSINLANRERFEKFADVNGSIARVYTFFKLRPNASVRIGEFYENLALGEGRHRQSYKSLIEFLHLMQDPHWLPYVDISGTLRTDLVDQRLESFYHKLVQWQSQFGQGQSPWGQGRIEKALYQILNALEPIGSERRPERHEQISHRDLTELLTSRNFAADWILFEKNHYGTVALKSLLKELADDYAQLSL